MGGYPTLAGQLLITENLSIKGNTSIFQSENETVQSLAYGFEINLTNKEKNNWLISVLFSQLQGPDDFKSRTIEGLLARELQLFNLPLFAGFGFNTFNTKILIDDVDSIPNRIKGSAHNFIIGAQVYKGRITVIPIFQFNKDVLLFSLELMRAFK